MADWLIPQVANDVSWMIHDAGESVVYRTQAGQSLDLVALFDANATEQPGFGYQQKISSKGHDVTIAQVDCGGYVPLKGDVVVYRGQEYQVEHVYPFDKSDVFRMAVIPLGKSLPPVDSSGKEYF
jgi:hypothetical protein